MLLGIFTFLSAAAAAALTVLLGGFDGFGWIWQLPLGFFGMFLILVALLGVLILIMAKLVNLDEVQEKDNKFYRWIINEVIFMLFTVLNINVHTQGLELIPKDKRVMVVCNHLNDIDPSVLLHYFRKQELAFISKRENDRMFVVGKFLRAILCQPINRENDREALKTILRCIQLLKDDEVSIAVFPEGYVSMDEKLHPFRPGVFKIAQKAKVPVVVCTLRDTQTVLKNVFRLKSSQVHFHVLGVIRPEEFEGITTVELAGRAHDMMAQDLGPELVLQENT